MLHTASTDKWLLRSESQEETPEKFPSSVDDHLLADLYDTKSGKGSQFRHTAITSTPGSNSSILTGKSSSDDVVRSSSLASCSSTPRRQHNPFDTHLGDILKGYTFSPSVFRTVASSNSPSPSVHDRIPQSDFRWSIDQMAIMNPVHIDDHHVLRQYLHQHQLHRNVDPHTEAKYQEAIDAFFANPEVLPSPPDVASRRFQEQQQPHLNSCSVGFITDSTHGGTPPSRFPSITTKTMACQTKLSIPIDFDLASVLGPDFYLENAEVVEENHDRSSGSNIGLANNSNSANASLRRKLFASQRSGKTSDDEVSSNVGNFVLDNVGNNNSESDGTHMDDVFYDENKIVFGANGPICGGVEESLMSVVESPNLSPISSARHSPTFSALGTENNPNHQQASAHRLSVIQEVSRVGIDSTMDSQPSKSPHSSMVKERVLVAANPFRIGYNSMQNSEYDTGYQTWQESQNSATFNSPSMKLRADSDLHFTQNRSPPVKFEKIRPVHASTPNNSMSLDGINENTQY